MIVDYVLVMMIASRFIKLLHFKMLNNRCRSSSLFFTICIMYDIRIFYQIFRTIFKDNANLRFGFAHRRCLDRTIDFKLTKHVYNLGDILDSVLQILVRGGLIRNSQVWFVCPFILLIRKPRSIASLKCRQKLAFHRQFRAG